MDHNDPNLRYARNVIRFGVLTATLSLVALCFIIARSLRSPPTPTSLIMTAADGSTTTVAGGSITLRDKDTTVIITGHDILLSGRGGPQRGVQLYIDQDAGGGISLHAPGGAARALTATSGP